MFAAVIVAAGKSTRMGQDKLFLEVSGLPVVGHTWQRFDLHPDISQTILVIRDELRGAYEELANRLELTKPYLLTRGGSERQHSVGNGLSVIPPEIEWVAIQDAARPCTTNQTITETLNAARESGAAVAASKSVDTLKLADGNHCISRNVDRTHLWAVQTPQAFRLKTIRQAMDAVRDQNASVTDDTAACELIGQPVRMVESDALNPKVTTRADLPLVELLLRQ